MTETTYDCKVQLKNGVAAATGITAVDAEIKVSKKLPTEATEKYVDCTSDVSTFFWGATALKVSNPTMIGTVDCSGCYLEIYDRSFFGQHITVCDSSGTELGDIKLKNDVWIMLFPTTTPDAKVTAIFNKLTMTNTDLVFALVTGCFPKNAMVQTPEGEKQCGKLKINDMVLVGDNKYEKIVLFSHFDRNVASNFTQLTLSNGKSVTATGSHLITVFNGNQEILKSFDSLAVGDKVQYNNQLRSVESKAEVVGKGLVCPVTASGNIVVDNVLCTCHANRSSMKVLTPIVKALAAADINVPNKLVKRYNAIR